MSTHCTRRLIAAGLCLGGLAMTLIAGRAAAQYPTVNTAMLSHIPLNGFVGSPGNGNDCWGYVSPSGREYALMGLENQLAVIEITNPASPVIVGHIIHSDSLWADVKVYQNYCYVSNETSGGIDVIDLSQVDSGIVTRVQQMTLNGVSSTHNVAMNEDSGYLYLCGSNVGGGRLMAFSLANPAAPTFAGQVASGVGAYSHDAQIVTYTSGPYAGKEIAFSFNGGIGLDIYDVTDKGNMIRLSRTVYSNLSYCHQGWLSEDRQYLYVNDETDGINETVIFDVSNLSAPVVAGSYTAGDSATDHNLYVMGDYIFESDYRGGVRIYCAADPINPVQVGYFDSYPADNGSGYAGAWSHYPYFPSGNMIISDYNSGFFVVDVSGALNAGSISFAYPAGRPAIVNPAGGTPLQVNMNGACGANVQPGTAQFHYNTGSGWTSVPMTEFLPGQYQTSFPGAPCAMAIPYYFTAEKEGGVVVADPTTAPASTYNTVAANSIDTVLADNFENDLGWTASHSGVTAGQWQRGVPVNDPNWEYDPETDGDGSGQCWLTQNTAGNSDVDGGSVTLMSPPFDLTAGNLTLAYHYYLRLTVTDGVDRLLVEVSSNGTSGPWTQVALYTLSSGTSAIDHENSIWTHEQLSDTYIASLGIALTNNMRVRFTANDSGTASIVEAGIDGFSIQQFQCDPGSCSGDLDSSGGVGVPDLLTVINSWGPCGPPCPADIAPAGTPDGTVGVPDLLAVINAWGPCP